MLPHPTRLHTRLPLGSATLEKAPHGKSAGLFLFGGLHLLKSFAIFAPVESGKRLGKNAHTQKQC